MRQSTEFTELILKSGEENL